MGDENRVSVELVVTQKGFELFDQAGKKVGEFSSATGKASGVVSEALKGIREGFDKELEGALKAAQGHKAVESSFSSLGAKIVEFNQALDLTGRVARGVQSAIDGVFAGINRGADLDDMSQRLGVAVEQLSSLELSAKLGGVSIESMGTGIQALSRNMAAAASGSKEAQAAFAAVGISAGDIGKLRTDEVLERIADRFSGAQDGAAKTALAMDLLGKSGAQMIPVLNAGSEGLSRNAELARQLGLVLDGETAQAMGNAADAVDILGMAVTGVQNQLATGMAPALSRVADMVVDFVANVGIADGGLRGLGSGIGDLIEGAVTPAIDALNDFAETAKLDGFGAAASQALADAEGALKTKALELGRAVGTAISDGITENIIINAEAILAKIPLIGTIAKIREAFHAATSTPDFDTGSVPFADIEAGWAKQARAIDSASAALDRNAAISRTAAGAYVMLGGDAALAAAAVTKGTIAYHGGADAAKKAADELAKLREGFADQVQAQAQATERTQAQTAAILQGIEAGDSYEQIMADVASSSLEVAAAQKLAEGQTVAMVQAWLEQADAAQDAAEANAKAKAALESIKQVDDLTAQVEVWRQVRDGVISTAQAYHELAVQAQIAKTGMDRANADRVVSQKESLQKEIDAIKDANEQKTEDSFDAFKSIDQAFERMLDGMIAGTLDFGDIWKSMGASMVQDFTESVGGISGLLGSVVDLLSGVSEKSKVTGEDLGSIGTFINAIGGGWDRFAKKDEWGNVQYNADGSAVTDWGSVAGAGIQGGATAYSLFSPSSATSLGGLIGKGINAQVLSAANGIGQALGTAIGAVASIYLGPFGGALGGLAGSGIASLISGAVDRDTLLGRGYTSGVEQVQSIFDPADVLGAILSLPTLGLAMRKGAESILDESKTFSALQAKLGDITVRSGGPESVYRNNLTGGQTARDRGFTGGQVDLTFGATGSLFSQLSKGELDQDSGRLGEAMGNIMAEFLSRGLADGMKFDELYDQLRLFAHEAGITLESSVASLGEVFTDSEQAAIHFGKLDPTAAWEQGVNAYSQALVGVTKLFEGDYPAGVNLTAIALRNMEKDGVNAFGQIDDKAKDTLLNLSQDTESTMKIVEELVRQGFRLDSDQMQEQLQAIAQSAAFVGENIGAVFTSDSVFSGIESIGKALKSTITNAVKDESLNQLFDKTRIAESFSPVYAVLDKLKGGDFNLTDQGGLSSFRTEMVAAIAEGKANLQEYIPQLRAIRDAADEVDRAIDEALKPTADEAFWANIAETFKANEEAIKGMAEGMFDVAVAAERAGAGLGQQATRDAMAQQVDQGIYSATRAAVSTAAGESPEAQRLAALTTEFQFKVQAALRDGVVSGAELADLTALKTKMHAAGQEVADGISEGTAALDPLFRADRRKEAQDAAAASLKDTVGTSAGSMFDVIKGGGSVEAGVKAFGESFRSSVRDNVLQGMQEALVQSVIMEGALGGLMGDLKTAVSVAMEDGMIDANEQAFIDGLAKGIGQATDNAISQLEPTVRALGGVAETVAGNTEKAEAKVGELDRSTRNASYGVDEMARRAAKSLEDVGNAVPPATVDGIKAGVGALSTAFGDAATGGGAAQIGAGIDALKTALADGTITPIEQGVLALQGAVGNQQIPAEIQAGLTALQGAIGSTAAGSAEEIGAGVGALKEAFADGVIDPIEAGMLKLQDAVGDEAIAGDIAAGMQALVGAVGLSGSGSAPADIKQGLEALRDAFGPTASPEEIQAGLAKIKAAFDAAQTDPIAQGIGAIRNALGGETGGGITDAASALIASLNGTGGLSGIADILTAQLGTSGAAGAAEETAAKLRELLQPATDDVAGALRSGFLDGLNQAEAAARKLADTLSGVGSIPGRANGGPVPAGTMAFVGERGPELILAHPGGGVSVMPLDGIPGYADGTGDLIGISPRNTGPFGHPRVPPPPAPPRQSESTDDNDLKVKLDIEAHLEEFLKTGDFATFSEQFEQSVNESVAQGIMSAILETGPLKAAMDKFNSVLSSEIEKAWADGSLSDEELANIRTKMAELGGPIKDIVKTLGPEVEALFADLGLGDSVGSDLRSALGSAFRDFASSGDLEGAKEAVRQAFNEATMNGIVDALLMEGPIADAIENASTGFSDAMREALADGVISEDEADRLKELGAELGTDLEAAFAGLDPAITALFDGMRDKAAESMAQAGDLIGGSLKGLLNDPANLNFETFSQSLRQSIFQNVAGGLVDAFIESAVTQGALAPMLGAISTIFDQIGQKQLTVGEANALIAEQIAAINGVMVDPAFRTSIEQLINGIGAIGKDLNAFPPAANAAANAAASVSDAVTTAQEDVCAGKCQLKQELVDMGNGTLDEMGRSGYEQQERWVPDIPAFASGGIVRRPTVALVGESGPELIIPLDALRGALDSGIDPALVRELEAARGDLVDAELRVLLDQQQSQMRGLDSGGSLSPTFGSLRSAMDAFSAPPPPQSGGDEETKQLLRDIAQQLRANDKPGADGAALNKLADAIRSQPLVLEGKVELDGLELTKSTLKQMRRMSRGGVSTTQGIS